MAFTEGVGSNVAGGASSSPSVTLASCTAGRHLFFAIFWDNGAVRTLDSVECSGELPVLVSTAFAVGDGNNSYMQIGYIKSLAGSGSKTITGTLSGSANWQIWVDEKQGSTSTTFLGTGLLRVAGNQPGGATTFNIGSVTTSAANSMIWGVTATASATGPSIAGHTGESIGTLWRKNHAFTLLDAGAAGSKSIDLTIDNYGIWSYFGAEFLLTDPAVGGVPKTTKLAMLGVG